MYAWQVCPPRHPLSPPPISCDYCPPILVGQLVRRCAGAQHGWWPFGSLGGSMIVKALTAFLISASRTTHSLLSITLPAGAVGLVVSSRPKLTQSPLLAAASSRLSVVSPQTPGTAVAQCAAGLLVFLCTLGPVPPASRCCLHSPIFGTSGC